MCESSFKVYVLSRQSVYRKKCTLNLEEQYCISTQRIHGEEETSKYQIIWEYAIPDSLIPGAKIRVKNPGATSVLM